MVTDSTTGCVGRDTVVVGLDTVSPTLALPAAELLTCARDSIDLTSLTDPGQEPLQYTWSTTDGTIPGSNDGPGIRTGTPGQYRLLLESTDNGCLTERTIRVNEDRTDPVAEAGPDLALDCRDRQLPPNPGRLGRCRQFYLPVDRCHGGSHRRRRRTTPGTDRGGSFPPHDHQRGQRLQRNG